MKCKYCDNEVKGKGILITCGSPECRYRNKRDYNKEYKKRDYVKVKERLQVKRWRENNKEKRDKYIKEYEKRPEVIKKRKDWYQKIKSDERFKERRRINQRKYVSQDRVKIMYKSYMKEYGNIYAKKRRAEDEYFRRVERLRNRFTSAILRVFKGIKLRKSSSYGIDFHKIAKHLGECPGKKEDYHIDHIKPICSFDLTKDSEVRKAFAPENHQWLTKKENQKKGGRYARDNN